MDSWERIVKIEKLDEAEHTVWGWLSKVVDAEGNPVVDSQGDIITPDELLKAAHRFNVESRQGDFMHDGNAQYPAVETHVSTPEIRAAQGFPTPNDRTVGWWVGLRVDKSLIAKIRAGEINDFSIGGSGRREDA